MTDESESKIDLWTEFAEGEAKDGKLKIATARSNGNEWTGKFDRRKAVRNDDDSGTDNPGAEGPK